jgi:CheY-like chemotaxis protein
LSRPPTVLCIDDDVLLLAIRKALLESSDFRVLTAENAPLELEIANREPIDVVILDYQMPGMDGGRVANELRRRRPEIAILLSSGLEEIPQSLHTIVDGVVQKGSSSATLKEEIERVMTAGPRLPEQIPQMDIDRAEQTTHARRFARSKQLPGRSRRKRSRQSSDQSAKRRHS